MFVRCRKKDVSLIASLIPHCIQIYEKTIKKRIEIFIDVLNCLPDDILGGIILTDEDENIFIDNTLDNRLERIFRYCIPEINLYLLNKDYDSD